MNSEKQFCGSQSGFTLVEMLMSMGIMFSVFAMSIGFLIESGRINFVSAEKNDINREVRKVVTRMATEAKQSNLFVVYKSAAMADRDLSTDRVRPNEAGDCLLLVYKTGYAEMMDMGVDPLHDPRPVNKLVLYYRSVTHEEDGQERGPVRRWVKDLSSSPETDADKIHNIEQMIPSLSVLESESSEVVELSEGLANGRLFYNFQNKTVMINGKIIHGNQAKWVTDTYNFSISPRG
ncbi:prepilin-type N-terminal cleavage/methylation domain-containing protein [Kiritimatiellaeota bacterium B1221]|nr:prepilin-type N-terminal cleavage/methylation domain-containing protein [Kiritimatiellaeota bacterium B1221]